MSEDGKLLESISRTICKSGKFECGQGCCAPICMEVLGDARSKCSHVTRVHGDLAGKIIATLPRPNLAEVEKLAEAWVEADKACEAADWVSLQEQELYVGARDAAKSAFLTTLRSLVDAEWDRAIEAAKEPAAKLRQEWLEKAERNETDGYRSTADICWARRDIAWTIEKAIAALRRQQGGVG